MNKTLAFLIAGDRLHEIMAASQRAVADQQGDTNGSPIFAAAAEMAEQEEGQKGSPEADQEGPCIVYAQAVFDKAQAPLQLAQQYDAMSSDLDARADTLTLKGDALISISVRNAAAELTDAATSAREQADELLAEIRPAAA
jgi:hypothetical protein